MPEAAHRNGGDLPAGASPHARPSTLRWCGKWVDQVTATLRSHGTVQHDRARLGDHSLLAEVKLAAVATGHTLALAPPGWADPQPSVPLPRGVTWRPLIGNPLVRRTWAAWPASSRRRGLSSLIAALNVTMR